jgi:signal transduction histidine kinase
MFSPSLSVHFFFPILQVNVLKDQLSEEHTVIQPFRLSNRPYELRCIPTYAWVDTAYSSTPLIISLGAAGIIFINLVLLTAIAFFYNWHREVHRSKELEEAAQKRAEALQALEQAQAVSDAANQSKSEFLGFLCHELRNPVRWTKIHRDAVVQCLARTSVFTGGFGFSHVFCVLLSISFRPS